MLFLIVIFGAVTIIGIDSGIQLYIIITLFVTDDIANGKIEYNSEWNDTFSFCLNFL